MEADKYISEILHFCCLASVLIPLYEVLSLIFLFTLIRACIYNNMMYGIIATDTIHVSGDAKVRWHIEQGQKREHSRPGCLSARKTAQYPHPLNVITITSAAYIRFSHPFNRNVDEVSATTLWTKGASESTRFNRPPYASTRPPAWKLDSPAGCRASI